jgi:hypothetical protein
MAARFKKSASRCIIVLTLLMHSDSFCSLLPHTASFCAKVNRSGFTGGFA